MRLSEAIRLGAMLHPQCFGNMTHWRAGGEFPVGNDEVVATCALGAAEAAGYMDVFCRNHAETACPQCPQWKNGFAQVIAHLNDWHRWSRERIADWVATQESADDRSEAPAPADAVARTAETVTG